MHQAEQLDVEAESCTYAAGTQRKYDFPPHIPPDEHTGARGVAPERAEGGHTCMVANTWIRAVAKECASQHSALAREHSRVKGQPHPSCPRPS